MDRTNPTPLRRWLIVRQGAIGDTILLSPLIQILRREFSQAWIEVMGVRERVELLTGEGMADCAVSSERPGMERLFLDDESLPEEIAEYLFSFDGILYFAGATHDRLHRRLQVNPKAIVRVYPALPDSTQKVHCVDHYVGILEGICKTSPVPIPRLSLREDEIYEANELLLSWRIDRKRDFILVLHPGAGSPSKQAPTEYFVQIAEEYRSKHSLVCLVSRGPADTAAVSQFCSAFSGRLHILPDLPLRQIASILSLSNKFVGNDSGITHVAAAVACPTTALFCGSEPAIWRPVGEHTSVRVLQS